jgi:hypothetical protein
MQMPDRIDQSDKLIRIFFLWVLRCLGVVIALQIKELRVRVGERI